MTLRRLAVIAGISAIIACFSVVAAPATVAKTGEAHSAGKSHASRPKLPQLLQEVEDKYAKAETLQADFTQVNEVAALKTKKQSSGTLMVKRPDKLRWETLKPDNNLLVSDGHKFWFYTPPFDETEHGQVIERTSSEAQSRLLNALLSGRFSAMREMKIDQESALRFRLTPKRGSAGSVLHAEIEVDPNDRLIQRVTLDHEGGNRTEVTLSNIRLGKPMPDSTFVFTPPPGTERVDE